MNTVLGEILHTPNIKQKNTAPPPPLQYRHYDCSQAGGRLRGEEVRVLLVQPALPHLVVAPGLPDQLVGGLHRRRVPVLLLVQVVQRRAQLLPQSGVAQGDRGGGVRAEEGAADGAEELWRRGRKYVE